MPELGPRLRRMHSLLAIRTGPGSVKFPADVIGLHMRFNRSIRNGHKGPVTFFKQQLVRIKYHNPRIACSVDRTADIKDDAIMTIRIRKSGGEGSNGEEITKNIYMSHKKDSQILEELMRETNAEEIPISAEDGAQLRQLAEDARRSRKDQRQMAAVTAEIKRKEALLAEARGELA